MKLARPPMIAPTKAYAGLPADAFPGGAIRTSEPALSRVTAAAQHRH